MAAVIQVYLSWHSALTQHEQRLWGLKKQMDAMLTGAGSLTLFAVCSELHHPIPPRTVLSRSAHRIALWRKTSCKGNCRSGSREDVYWSDGWNVGRIILHDRLILKWGTFKRLFMCSCQSASPIRVCVLWRLESLSAKGLMQWEWNKVIRTRGAHCEHVKFELEKGWAKEHQTHRQLTKSFLAIHTDTQSISGAVYA